jgi:AcrR family transcriptional regulator
MSPALAKTSDDDIVAAARAIIAEVGVDRLSLAGVAAAVGIKAPSLYKRFADRDALVDAVRDNVLSGLAETLSDASRHRDPEKQLVAMATTYRKFGKENPELYRLIPASGGEPSDAARAAVAPLFKALTGMVGDDMVLPAARCLTAYLHGFVSLEISGGFQLGGSVEQDFRFGLDVIVRGLRS